MRTVALSEHTATRLAYRQYLGLLAEDDRGFRQAFRTAFFRAMREQLTPRQYEVLWMIEVEGLSCKQCAERLGISPSAVSRHCSRGKMFFIFPPHCVIYKFRFTRSKSSDRSLLFVFCNPKMPSLTY